MRRDELAADAASRLGDCLALPGERTVAAEIIEEVIREAETAMKERCLALVQANKDDSNERVRFVVQLATEAIRRIE